MGNKTLLIFAFLQLSIVVSGCKFLMEPVDKCMVPLETNGVSMLTLEHGFAWSPNGVHIAYTNNDQHLFLKDVTSDPVNPDKQLVGVEINPNSIRWSPNNQKIAFTSRQNNNWAVFVIDILTGHISKLSDEGENILPFLDWSLDSQDLLYTQEKLLPIIGTQAIEIVQTNIDTLEKETLYKGDSSTRLGAWLSDRNELLYFATTTGGSKLYRLPSDTKEATRVTNLDACERQPDWTLNNEGIIFVATPQNNWDVFVTTDIGGNVLNLTGTPDMNEFWPNWSPDGERIAYMGVGNVGHQIRQEIYVINKDGSNNIQLTNTPDKHEYLPLWSPDGNQLAFISKNADDSWDIELVDSEGNNRVTIISQP